MTRPLSLATGFRRAIPLFTFLAFATPASADHAGPGSFGGGGGLLVFSPDVLDRGHGAAGLRISYTRPEQRSDEVLASLAGRAIDAHNTDHNLNASLGLAYGVSHRLTVSAELPYLRREGLREGSAANGVERLGNIAGFGDMSLLAKYGIINGPGGGFALLGGLKLPTGSTHRRSLEGERLETEHQPGTGSWDPIVGVSASARVGVVAITTSAVFQFSTRGAQRTTLGDRWQGGIALSHRFGERAHEPAPSHDHHDGEELDEHAETHGSSWDAFVELAGEWEGRQKVDGEVERESGGKWAYVAPGLRFNAASGWSASATLSLPVWQRIRATHPDNRYRVTLSVGRSF